MNVFEEEIESVLTYLCQMLKTGVERDSIVDQGNENAVDPSSKPPKVLITKADHNRRDHKDDWLFLIQKIFSIWIVFLKIVSLNSALVNVSSFLETVH